MTASPTHLAHLTPAVLTPLVQAALQDNSAQVDTCQVDTLAGGAGDQGAGTSGIYRLHGQARAGEDRRPWTLILKYSRPAPGSELSGDEREWQAYASGLLAKVSGPFATAPRCFAAQTRPDGELWLWLEAIDDIGGDWSPTEYAHAAYHLGTFNAYFAQQPLDWPWLSRRWLRGWVAQRAGDIDLLRTLASDHPDVSRAFPPDVASGILALWDDRETLLNALEQLPQTLCHLDAFRRNLLSRRQPDGQTQLVLIDWAFTGIAAPGEELAPLIVASEGFEHAAAPDMAGLEAAVYPAYVEGLRAAGWAGDPRAVRFAYCAAAALRYGLPILMQRYLDPGLMGWVASLVGVSPEVLIQTEPGWRRYLLGLADEARALLPVL